jgi:hypothetical protein
MVPIHGCSSSNIIGHRLSGQTRPRSYPAAEQMAALRMCLDPSMQQIVEIVLGISPATPTTPDDVLDRIRYHVREKRNVALDRVAFEERRQGPVEPFDENYISLRRLADAADIYGTCFDG